MAPSIHTKSSDQLTCPLTWPPRPSRTLTVITRPVGDRRVLCNREAPSFNSSLAFPSGQRGGSGTHAADDRRRRGNRSMHAAWAWLSQTTRGLASRGRRRGVQEKISHGAVCPCRSFASPTTTPLNFSLLRVNVFIIIISIKYNLITKLIII